MTEDRSLHEFRQLDPAQSIASDATAQIRKNAMLERVLATPQTTTDTVPVLHRRRFVGRIVLTGAAAAVVGAVLIAHGLVGGGDGGEFTSAELASWVATPTPRATSELSAATKAWCADSTAQQSRSAPTFSNGDQRGKIASMVVARGGYRDLCLTTGNGEGSWEILDGPSNPLPAVTSRSVNLQSESSHGDPATSVNTIWGQAGSDIAALRLHVDGRDVTATVGGGIWSAWWPGSIGFDAPTTATVMYTDGSTATVALPQA